MTIEAQIGHMAAMMLLQSEGRAKMMQVLCNMCDIKMGLEWNELSDLKEPGSQSFCVGLTARNSWIAGAQKFHRRVVEKFTPQTQWHPHTIHSPKRFECHTCTCFGTAEEVPSGKLDTTLMTLDNSCIGSIAMGRDFFSDDKPHQECDNHKLM